jgi:hypothetical protein
MVEQKSCNFNGMYSWEAPIIRQPIFTASTSTCRFFSPLSAWLTIQTIRGSSLVLFLLSGVRRRTTPPPTSELLQNLRYEHSRLSPAIGSKKIKD